MSAKSLTRRKMCVLVSVMLSVPPKEALGSLRAGQRLAELCAQDADIGPGAVGGEARRAPCLIEISKQGIGFRRVLVRLRGIAHKPAGAGGDKPRAPFRLMLLRTGEARLGL